MIDLPNQVNKKLIISWQNPKGESIFKLKFDEWRIEIHYYQMLLKVKKNISTDITRMLHKLLFKRTWAGRSERLRGEPFIQWALTSPTLTRVHFGWHPLVPLKCQINRLQKPWRAACSCPFLQLAGLHGYSPRSWKALFCSDVISVTW